MNFKLVDESGLASTRPTRMAINITGRRAAKSSGIHAGDQWTWLYRKPEFRFPIMRETNMDCRSCSLSRSWRPENAKENELESRNTANRKIWNATGPDRTPTTGSWCPRTGAATDSCRSKFAAVGAGRQTRLPGTPNQSDSAEFLIRVVSSEELRADLLRREIEQRKAFQRAYDSQLEVMAELQALAAAERLSESEEKFDAERQDRIISLARDQKLIGTNVSTIADRFEEYLVETQNNRLDEDNIVAGLKSFSERFDNNIIKPIRYLDGELIATASRNIDNCRRLLNNRSGLSDAVGQHNRNPPADPGRNAEHHERNGGFRNVPGSGKQVAGNQPRRNADEGRDTETKDTAS